LIIYTESDYLDAHLTEIATESRGWTVALDAVPQRVTDVLKKFTSRSEPSSSSSPRNKKPSER